MFTEKANKTVKSKAHGFEILRFFHLLGGPAAEYLSSGCSFYLFIFRERGRKKEREGEKDQYVVASGTPPTRDVACNPGVCPDGNQTSDALVCRPALNPLSHTSQGLVPVFRNYFSLLLS